MYGLIGTIHPVPGARDELAAILIDGFGERIETRPRGGQGLGSDA